MREETETERQRRLEETRKEIAAETARALEQIRAEVADLTLEAASRVVGKTLDAERDRELIAEAIGSLDFSRLEESSIAVAHRIYAEALFERREGGRPARAGARGARRLRRGDRAVAGARAPSCATRSSSRSAKARILADLAGDEEPLFTNFLLLVGREGPRGRDRGDRAGVRAADGARGAAAHRRAHDGARADATTRRTAIVAQIEKAAGRKVEATRSVDPDLVGGIVLQAGSFRVDASVRGRLERLRQELVKS